MLYFLAATANKPNTLLAGLIIGIVVAVGLVVLTGLIIAIDEGRHDQS